jgi:hypothetical protein
MAMSPDRIPVGAHRRPRRDTRALLRGVSAVANKAKRNSPCEAGPRVGYGISGVLQLLIGWIAN